jgi:hypothetical protein
MIFNRCIFFICLFPLVAFSANQPCGLTDFEQMGKGWLSAKNTGVLKYAVARKQFESTSMPKSWTVSLQAREAALKGFAEQFRKISPPTTDKSVFSIKGMQAKEMHCAEGFFIFYEVSVANLAWETPTVDIPKSKEDIGIQIDKTSINVPTLGVPNVKEPLITPSGVIKVLIED